MCLAFHQYGFSKITFNVFPFFLQTYGVPINTADLLWYSLVWLPNYIILFFSLVLLVLPQFQLSHCVISYFLLWRDNFIKLQGWLIKYSQLHKNVHFRKKKPSLFCKFMMEIKTKWYWNFFSKSVFLTASSFSLVSRNSLSWIVYSRHLGGKNLTFKIDFIAQPTVTWLSQ